MSKAMVKNQYWKKCHETVHWTGVSIDVLLCITKTIILLQACLPMPVMELHLVSSEEKNALTAMAAEGSVALEMFSRG